MDNWRTWWIAGDKAIPDGHIVPDKYLGGVKVIEIDALKKLIEALKQECCCPGEVSWTTKQPILCDPCEALSRLPKELMK